MKHNGSERNANGRQTVLRGDTWMAMVMFGNATGQ